MGHCGTAGMGANLLTGITDPLWELKCLCPPPFLSLHLSHGIQPLDLFILAWQTEDLPRELSALLFVATPFIYQHINLRQPLTSALCSSFLISPVPHFISESLLFDALELHAGVWSGGPHKEYLRYFDETLSCAQPAQTTATPQSLLASSA